jgi:hypothetical protein
MEHMFAASEHQTGTGKAVEVVHSGRMIGQV